MTPRVPVLEVLDPGLLLAVQDAGRPGLACEGVTRGGAADTWSLGVANVLVGNGPGDAALEATLLGPTLRALAPARLGIAGAMAARVLETGLHVVPGASLALRAGETLVLEPSTGGGARGYVAVAGGIDVPIVLGGRGTALGAGFGGLEGRALRAGDLLGTVPRGEDPHGAGIVARWPGSAAPTPVTRDAPLRLLPGPHVDRLPEAIEALCDRAWTVAPASDRQGIRLDGGPVGHTPESGGAIASLGVVEGAVQVPPDGRPIVLLADHQPTGGYPVPAAVITADLPRLGQLAPGDTVAFALVTPAAARDALVAADVAFASAAAHLREAAVWDDLWRGAGA